MKQHYRQPSTLTCGQGQIRTTEKCDPVKKFPKYSLMQQTGAHLTCDRSAHLSGRLGVQPEEREVLMGIAARAFLFDHRRALGGQNGEPEKRNLKNVQLNCPPPRNIGVVR